MGPAALLRRAPAARAAGRARRVAAIDLGGSSVRAGLFDERGRLLALRSRPHRFIQGEDGAPFTRELDAEAAWRAATACIRGAMRDAGVRSDEVEAVAAAGQRHGLALITDEGRTLYVGPTSEARAFFHGQVIEEDFGAEIYAATGHLPALLGAPAKLRWLAEALPDFDQATRVLTLDGWLAHRLSGEAVMTPVGGVVLGLVDLRSLEWADDLLDRIGFPRGLLPRLATPASVIGEVSPRAARETSLAVGTPVVAAGPDTQCGLLGMGAAAPGAAGILAGSTAPVQMVLDRPVLDAERRTWTGAHVLEDRWVIESGATDAGGAVAWLADLVLGGGPGAARAFDRVASKAPAGSGGALAFLGPRQADASDLGPRWGGLLFATPLAASPMDRGRLFRAALENVAYAIRANVEQIERVAGRAPDSIAVSGGLTASRTFCRILTDVLGSPVRVTAAESSALGAAICAAAGVGWYASLPAAARRMAARGRTLKPDAGAALEYNEHYRRWLGMAHRLEEAGDLL